jgi:hypothetical protein
VIAEVFPPMLRRLLPAKGRTVDQQVRQITARWPNEWGWGAARQSVLRPPNDREETEDRRTEAIDYRAAQLLLPPPIFRRIMRILFLPMEGKLMAKRKKARKSAAPSKCEAADERHGEFLEWCGGWLDPDALDLEVVTWTLGRGWTD